MFDAKPRPTHEHASDTRIVMYSRRENVFKFFLIIIFCILEGENLLRDLEMLRDRAEYYARQNRQINPLNGVGYGQNKRFDTLRYMFFF